MQKKRIENYLPLDDTKNQELFGRISTSEDHNNMRLRKAMHVKKL